MDYKEFKEKFSNEINDFVEKNIFFAFDDKQFFE
jgi:hypothetical protein